jgi:beta-galactosidase
MQCALRRNMIPLILFLLAAPAFSSAAPGRWEQTLSGPDWTLHLDPNAAWENDELFLPPVDVAKLPVNPPTGGWDAIDRLEGKKVSVPGTVEEHYWSANGNFVGTSGDYRGVSWWSTSFRLDPMLKGKRIVIAFECVNLRAEVFLNRKLVGYDIVGNTQFEVDATAAAAFGAENRLDVRITDPGGNFSWPAHTVFTWGKYTIPIVRGFGGITGDVTVRAVDPVSVADVWVLNTPKITEAKVFASVRNSAAAPVKGKLTLIIHEYGNPAAVLWKKTVSETVPPGEKEYAFTVNAPKAKVWNLMDPHLYTARAEFGSSDGASADAMGRRFGFRWFTVGTKFAPGTKKDGDERFYLNGKRVFIMATVNRGYWAVNGMYASPEMAKRDVEAAISMGYNALAYHNAIGQPNLVKAADEYGLLSTGESGGYRINDDRGKPVPDEFTRVLRREKLFRFIKRDRSCPSLVAYMLKNEDQNPPEADDMKNIAGMRTLDPSRIILYTGDRNRTYPAWQVHPDDTLKLFYKPYDAKEYYYGWFDMHHWNPQAGWLDDYYRNPRNFMRLDIDDGDSTHLVRKDEIIFYGEEGAFGTTLRLGKIKEEIDRKGSSDGWREKEHLDWFAAYDRFIDEAGFRSSYQTVDALTLALAKNMHYFHGRVIENARISNVIDAYNLNGWASAATHSDIADSYRFPTADPSILKYYNQPLYVAVKIRDKVLPKGAAATADIYIVNEKDLKGTHSLELELADPAGKTVFTKTFPVTVLGGEEYGQLLVEGVVLPPVDAPGYYVLNARITDKGAVKCTGHDDIFAVDYTKGPGLPARCAIIDTSGAVNALLKSARGVALPAFTRDMGRLDLIVVGAHDFRNIRSLYQPVMNRVKNGATLVILDKADSWAEQLDDIYEHQAIQYTSSDHYGSGGRLFVGKSALLDGLPSAQSMNWEYQVFYRGDVWGINMNRAGNETVVALASQARKDILTAVAVIPFGNGRIVLSTLNLLPWLTSDKPQAATAKKMFMNFLELGGK